MGLTTALFPTTRVCAVYVAIADSPLLAPNPDLTTTLMSYVPCCMGFQMKLSLRLKSLTTWRGPPCSPTLNW